MGQQHNELRNGLLSHALTAAVGDTRHGGLERYGETLTPHIDLWSRPEFAKLRGEHLHAVRTVQLAVVAEFAGIALTNPSDTGFIIVVESVQVGTPVTAHIVNLESGATGLISGTYLTITRPASMRDRRFVTTATSALSVGVFIQGSDLANTFGVQHEQQVAPAGSTRQSFTSPPYIIRPGDALFVIGQTVNLDLNANWKWYERRALPGELE